MKRHLFITVVLTVMLTGSISAQNLAVGTVSTFAGTTSGEMSSVTAIGGQPVIGLSGDVYAGIWGVIVPLGIATVEEPAELPMKWEIGTAYPNPFNPSVAFSVSLPVSVHLKAEVYNVLGQRVEVLANRQMPQGQHRLVWNAHGCASGVYFLRAEVPQKMHRIQRVVLIR